MAHELEAFMSQVQAGLASEYERIFSRATEDPGTAGDEGEENWAAFLRAWLPETYHVVTKGRLLSVDGEASAQMDVVVLKPSYPPALRNKKLYLAGGVAAAFECKTTMTRAHIDEAFETAAQIQALAHPAPPRSTRHGTPFRELHGSVVYGLLAHSHRWSDDSAVGHVTNAVQAGLSTCAHPREMLDVVCVADLGAWITMKTSYFGSRLNMWDHDQMRETFPDGYAACVSFGPAEEGDFPESRSEGFSRLPVAQLCAGVTSRLAWEDESMRPIADYFRVVGMHGRGRGGMAGWGLDDVYSEAVRNALRRGRIEDAPWSEWRHVFM